MHRLVPFALLLLAALSAGGQEPADEFTSRVLPILKKNCFPCHSHQTRKSEAGLMLDSAGAIRKGGDSGPAVVAGDPSQGPLVERITSDDPSIFMPPKGNRLSPEDVAALKAWIQNGALGPEPGESLDPPSADHWAYRPIVRPEIPHTSDEEWPRNAVDRFILARLEAAGIAPAPPADARTLLRRLYFDLWGLPPPPGAADRLASNPSPNAWERLVDSLLASPRYGERWARHWLDVARYAETHGHDQDRVRENAWPFRDWVIRAFNDDKPLSRFVQEQIAADVLFPSEPELIPALGFLAAGPWDESSLRDIREDTIDREIGRYLDRDDVVTAVTSAFVSTSAHCARCHDHKFDPIPQEDYYALQAVFAGVEKANRTYDLDLNVADRRARLRAQLAGLDTATGDTRTRLLSADSRSRVEAWVELQRAEAGTLSWTVAAVEAPRTSQGTELAVQPDGSLLATGTTPATDSYTVSFQAPAGTLTGLMLDVLPDDSLPAKGPGRAENGNLHLSEIKLEAAPLVGGEPRPLQLVRPLADFDQEGWTIAHAVDGNPDTAWGVFPRVGQPHQAVFELAEPLAQAETFRLSVTLDQLHGRRHVIGKFRLSFTGSAPPLGLPKLPPRLARLVSLSPAERTDDEQVELSVEYWKQTWGAELATLPAPHVVYAAAADFEPDAGHKPSPGPRLVQVLQRGDLSKPISDAQPGALSLVAQLPSRFAVEKADPEGGRRRALALWLSHENNPLVWRSMANRLWQHHFGRGLVETPNDFGRMGTAPSHPELLDHLAAELRDSGGSLKALHRQILTSATWRQSALASAGPSARAVEASPDPDNRLLGRMNRRRMDAESIRDAILSVSDRLDLAMGGPSARHFELSPGIHVTPIVDYTKFDWDRPEGVRRSIYRFVFRTLPDPFMEALDVADASQSTPVRTESASPLGALVLWNNAFVLNQAEHFARRLEREAGNTRERVDRAYELALARSATPDEIEEGSALSERFGLAAFCRALFNLSEFVYVE